MYEFVWFGSVELLFSFQTSFDSAMEFLSSVFAGFIAILLCIFAIIVRQQNYFKRHGVAFVKANPIIGAFSEVILGKCGLYENLKAICNQVEVKNEPFFGFSILQKPAMMITDPKLIKRVLVSDFKDFANRYNCSDTHDSLGYYNLFAVKNPLWKRLRTKLTPFFSSGKLKNMFYIMDIITDNVLDHIRKCTVDEGKTELELKDLAANYSTDVIASCAFGVDTETFKNPNGEFSQVGKAINDPTISRRIGIFCGFFLPMLTRLINFKTFTESGSKFIRKTIHHVMNEREKSGHKRNDLIDMLIELKKTDPDLTM